MALNAYLLSQQQQQLSGIMDSIDSARLFTPHDVDSKLLVSPTNAGPMRSSDVERVLSQGGIRDFFQQIHEAHGVDFHSAVIHSNYESCGDNELPKGVMVMMNADAEVDPRLISSRIGSALYMLEIPQEQVSHKTLAHIQSKLEDLNAAVPQHHPEAATLTNALHDGPTDEKKWTATLGGGGNFVGVAYTDKDRGTGRFFLRAKTDGGIAARQLKAFVNYKVQQARKEGKVFSYRNLVNSKQYATTIDLSRRNALRILATVAKLLGFTVLVREDTKAAVCSKHDIRPMMAYSPHLENQFGHIYIDNVNGKNVAVIANQVTYTPKAKGGLAFNADSTYKSLLYRMPESKVGVQVHSPLSNAYMSSFSPFTGKSRAPLSTQSATIGADVAEFVEANITWEGKARGHENSRVMNRYAPIKEANRAINDEILRANHGVYELRPAISKIASDTPDYMQRA